MPPEIRRAVLGTLEFGVQDCPRTLSPHQREHYEAQADSLARRCMLAAVPFGLTFSMKVFGLPSLVMRLDIAGDVDSCGSVLEVEFGTSGLGIAQEAGAVSVIADVATALKRYGLTEIGAYSHPARVREKPEQHIALAALGTHGIRVCESETPAELPSNCPLWLNADSVRPSHAARSLFWPYPESHTRSCLIGIDRTALLSQFDTPDQLHGRFNSGYVVKPLNGRNGNGILYWTLASSGKRNADRKHRIAALLQSGRGDAYLVQQLFPAGLRRTLSLFFVASESGYRFAGGMQMRTRKPIVKVGPRTVLQPVF